MYIMSWKDIFIKQTETWTFSQLSDKQVTEVFVHNDPLVSELCYVTITLKSMRVNNVREFYTKFYGIAHSFISLTHLAGGTGSFHTVTTPTELKNLDAGNLDKVIMLNKPLAGPVPYRGGSISMDLALFSIKESDLLAPYIELLESIAGKAGVSVLSTAVPFLEPLKKGIDSLTNRSGDTHLEIGLSTTFSDPTTGWFVVMRAPKAQHIIEKVKVSITDFSLIEISTGKPLTGFPYMVFSITKQNIRSDWAKIPYLLETYNELRAAVRKGSFTEAEQLLTVFKRVAMTSEDLLLSDSARIASLVDDEIKLIMKATMISAGLPQDLPPLEKLLLYPPKTI
jgi:hypothetical protein